MWFLLTGAPPLMAPKGPLAVQPTTIGLAVDKLNGMPTKVRRLLAQMLAVNPGDRPQDPLALYRQLQDCVAQVERRETMARRFGIPLSSESKAADFPSRRPFPTKLVALAASVLAIAALAAVIVPQYLRHQRVRQAEEPIGVQIGVPDATAPAAPVVANAPVVASVPAQPEPTPQPITAQEKQPPAPVESTPVVVANNQPAIAPSVQPEVTQPPASVPPTEPPTVAANDRKVTQETTTAPQPAESVRPEVREPATSHDTEVAAAIPTARPVSPEVRRAEPAPPGEGPEEMARVPEKKIAPSVKTKKDRAPKPKRELNEEEVPSVRLANEDEETDAALPQLPRGRTRAKFIGVTADGNWMFSLPSKKIVIVPPPPGG